jgi:hypothetical protein
VGRGDVVSKFLAAHLELEKIESFALLGVDLGDIFLGCGIAEEPHRCDRAAQCPSHEVDRR